MEPVRVNYYGMFDITKPVYLPIQIVVLLITVSLFFIKPLLPASAGWIKELWHVLVAAVLIAECIEAAVMLGKFREKERQRQADLSAARPPPLPPVR